MQIVLFDRNVQIAIEDLEVREVGSVHETLPACFSRGVLLLIEQGAHGLLAMDLDEYHQHFDARMSATNLGRRTQLESEVGGSWAFGRQWRAWAPSPFGSRDFEDACDEAERVAQMICDRIAAGSCTLLDLATELDRAIRRHWIRAAGAEPMKAPELLQIIDQAYRRSYISLGVWANLRWQTLAMDLAKRALTAWIQNARECRTLKKGQALPKLTFDDLVAWIDVQPELMTPTERQEMAVHVRQMKELDPRICERVLKQLEGAEEPDSQLARHKQRRRVKASRTPAKSWA